jgi:CO/xanthine dehydrogenase FAD-binding subunit
MKPAPFEYRAPATLREAIDLLVSDPEATVIAGGQSLMPVLAFRLAAPRTTTRSTARAPRSRTACCVATLPILIISI